MGALGCSHGGGGGGGGGMGFVQESRENQVKKKAEEGILSPSLPTSLPQCVDFGLNLIDWKRPVRNCWKWCLFDFWLVCVSSSSSFKV